MFKDSAHFVDRAKTIVGDMGVNYQRVTSGSDKGKYFASLSFMANVPIADRANYLIKKWGYPDLPRVGRVAKFDKKEAEEELVRTIGFYLYDFDRINNPQYFSDLYDYYKKNVGNKGSKMLFDIEVGDSAKNYFEIIDGTINQNNWRETYLFQKLVNSPASTVGTFNDFYTTIKNKAAYDWNEKNELYSSRNHSNVKTFIFNTGSIPDVKMFEDNLKFSKSINNKADFVLERDSSELSILENIDLSNLANSGNVKIGFRKNEFLNTKIVLGREREIIFPNEETHKAYFAVVELSQILASHNEVTFADTANYPTDDKGKNVNDRNYGTDKNAQAKVVTVAQKLNPNIIISTSATASGTPVITVDGIVVSGNNRTMSLKLAASTYKQNFDTYLATLYSELDKGGYGISMAGVYGKFKQPVLVRVDVDFHSYTSTELNAFNKPRAKSEKNIDRSIRLSKQIAENKNCQNALIDLVSEQDVVSELYNDRASVNRFKKILLDCNIITDNEISAFFTDFSLTETGKILYDTLLVSLVLNPQAIEISQNAGVKSATNAIVNAIIPLVKNKNQSEASIINDVNNALLIQNAMVSGGYKKLSEFITENTIFAEKEPYKTEKAFIINWYLNQRVNDFKTAMLKYNNSVESNQGGSLFGDSMTPDEIFNSVFTSGADSQVVKAIDTFKKHDQPAVEPKAVETNSLPEKGKELLLSRLQKASKYL